MIHYDGAIFDAHTECADPGSVRDDQGCPIDSEGKGVDAACRSGYCGIASLAGSIVLGVCGECERDSDCACGETTGTSTGGEGDTGASTGTTGDDTGTGGALAWSACLCKDPTVTGAISGSTCEPT